MADQELSRIGAADPVSRPAGSRIPFVGMGLTYYFKEQVYAGTIVRISDDFQSIWFKQDRPHMRARERCVAFIFTPGGGSEYEAKHEAPGYVWGGRLVLLGVRTWRTTPFR